MRKLAFAEGAAAVMNGNKLTFVLPVKGDGNFISVAVFYRVYRAASLWGKGATSGDDPNASSAKRLGAQDRMIPIMPKRAQFDKSDWPKKRFF